MNHLSNVTKQKTKTKFSWFLDLGLFWLEPISKWKNLKYKNYTRFTKRDHMQKKKSSLIKSRFTLKANCLGECRQRTSASLPQKEIHLSCSSFLFLPCFPSFDLLWPMNVRKFTSRWKHAIACIWLSGPLRSCHGGHGSSGSCEGARRWKPIQNFENSWRGTHAHSRFYVSQKKTFFFLKPLSLWLVCYCSMIWLILADTAGQISSDPGRPNLVSSLFYFLLLLITVDKSEYPATQAQLSSVWLVEEKGERDGDHCSLMSSHDFQYQINITRSALISPPRFFYF